MEIDGNLYIFNSSSDYLEFKYMTRLSPSFEEIFRANLQNHSALPTLYIITLTNYRPTQMADLVGLRNTLWLIPKIVWIVIESLQKDTIQSRTESFLAQSGIKYAYLSHSNKSKIDQWNIGLKWLRDHQTELNDGVIHFANDNNRYDIRLFQQVQLIHWISKNKAFYWRILCCLFFFVVLKWLIKMRYTKKVSVWPIGFTDNLFYEAPDCNGTKVWIN